MLVLLYTTEFFIISGIIYSLQCRFITVKITFTPYILIGSTVAISHDAILHMSATMSKKKVSKREEFKQEEVLQAVVIADSFNTRFAPLTHNRPRVK